jgi:DNA-binding Lrp family transcriptional regulator
VFYDVSRIRVEYPNICIIRYVIYKETETCEIKLEVFALVDLKINVLEARKNIIEKLSEQEEVSEVLKVYVNKSDTNMDVDNLRWNSVDIFLTPKGGCKEWKESKFRKNMFSKCCLWESFESLDGDVNREEFNRKKEEKKLYELWSMGYLL